MNVFLLDTHALYWHLFRPTKLSAPAKQAIADGEAGLARLVISHIALAELYFLLKKLGQEPDFAPSLAAIRTNPNYSIEPVALDDIEKLPVYPEVPEMHDRLLVAAANRLGGTLVTIDAIIQASPQVKWLW
jgi:PIN domain nuclease of toxin-antitoxin system